MDKIVRKPIPNAIGAERKPGENADQTANDRATKPTSAANRETIHEANKAAMTSVDKFLAQRLAAIISWPVCAISNNRGPPCVAVDLRRTPLSWSFSSSAVACPGTCTGRALQIGRCRSEQRRRSLRNVQHRAALQSQNRVTHEPHEEHQGSPPRIPAMRMRCPHRFPGSEFPESRPRMPRSHHFEYRLFVDFADLGLPGAPFVAFLRLASAESTAAHGSSNVVARSVPMTFQEAGQAKLEYKSSPISVNLAGDDPLNVPPIAGRCHVFITITSSAVASRISAPWSTNFWTGPSHTFAFQTPVTLSERLSVPADEPTARLRSFNSELSQCVF